MKIALVSPYDWAHTGGVNNHISALSNQFVQRGHRTTILAPSSKPAEEVEGDNLVLIGQPVPLPLSGSWARVSLSFHRNRQIKRLLDEEEFDVVHMHEPLFPVPPVAALRFSKALNVGTFHAYARRSRGYRGFRPLLKRWYGNLHGKIAVSKPAAELVGRYYPGDFKIIPNGIDLAHFSADAPPFERFMDGKLNILFVGRMEKRKGLRFLLAAFARLKWEYPQLRLIVVGPGRLDAASERILGERYVEDVEVIGGVPYDDLPRYYRTADIFCSPATGGESFGIVLLEAMAAGAPVLASNIPGYAGVVDDGETGLLFEPNDEVSLANAIVRLMQQPELRARMAAKGRVHVQRFSWDRVASEVLSYYDQLLDERAPLRGLRGLR